MILRNKTGRDDHGGGMTRRDRRHEWLRTIVIVLTTFLLSAAALGDASEAWMLDGSVGGVLSANLTNDHGESVRCRIAVPDRYVVLRAEFTMGRGVVVVAEPRGSGWHPTDTVYEIWLFRRRDAAHTRITFEDRQVIYSSATASPAQPGGPDFFISMGVYERPCEGLTAVHFGSHLAGGTLLFTSCGDHVPFEAERIAAVLGASTRDVAPLAWLHFGGRFYLALQVTSAAGARKLMTFDPDTGDFAMLPMSTLDESTLNKLLWTMSGQRH